MHEVEAAQQRLEGAGVVLAVGGELEVGAAGVLTASAPGGLAMAHEDDATLRLG